MKAALFVVIPLALFAAVGYATVVYVRSNNKTIKIEVDDPAAKVIIDGEEIEISGIGDTVKLRTGMHKLIVERGDLVVHTREFEVVKGKNPVLRISLESATVADAGGPAAPTSGTPTSEAAPLPKPVLAATFDEGADTGLQVENRGATFIPGKVGRALNSDGKGFVLIPATLPAGNSPRTIAAWLNVAEEKTSHNHHAIAYGREKSSLKQFGIYHGKGQWAAYGAGISLVTEFQSGWHHHCVTFDGKEMVYLFDGKIVGQRKATLDTTAGPLVLGNFADLGAYFQFDGLIDDVRVYDTALNEGQIEELLAKQGVTAAGSGATTGPLSVAPFDAAAAQKHQQNAAQRLGTSVEITNSIGMKFRLVPAGRFEIGSTQAEIDALLPTAINADFPKRFSSEGPQRQITLTQPFFLGQFEVTQAEYQQVMGSNPSAFSDGGAGKATVAGLDTGRFPIEQVSWFDAVDFCIKLSQDEGLRPCYSRVDDTVTVLDGNGYRLPTEAEWEFACRAGTQTRWSFGDDPQEWTKYGWFQPNAEGRTHEVGKLPPNQFGLYDMHGNVWEWCQDWHAYDAYDRETRTSDPVGPSEGTRRVLRGGSFFDTDPLWVRAAYRGYDLLGNRTSRFGFRIARTATGSASNSANEANDDDAVTIADATTTFQGHTGLVRAVAVSPDGKIAASGGHDTVVRLWDVETGKELRTLEGHEDAIHDLEFSPDGQLLATASGGKYEKGALVNPADMSIRVWDVSTGQQVKRVTGHTKPVVGVSFSLDSKQLASISNDKTIRLWEIESGTMSRQLADDISSAMDIAFTPDGKSVVVGDRYKNIHVWNMSTGEKLNRIPTQAVGVESIAVSPDGRYLLVGFHDEFAIRLLDIQTGNEIREFRGHAFPGGKGPAGYPSTITSLTFSKDGKRFVSCATDGTARVWDLETGRQAFKIAVHGKVGYVMSAAFTPDGRHVLSAANDVFLYELPQ